MKSREDRSQTLEGVEMVRGSSLFFINRRTLAKVRNDIRLEKKAEIGRAVGQMAEGRSIK
jgi:hypothetical protein